MIQGFSSRMLFAAIFAVGGLSAIYFSNRLPSATCSTKSQWSIAVTSHLERARECEKIGMRDAARSSLKAAAVANPFELETYRIAARLSESPRARRDMLQAASRLSLRDSYVHGWLAEDSIQSGNYTAAFLHLDVLLRREAASPVVVATVVGRSLHSSRAVAAFAKLLRQNPPWRQIVLQEIGRRSAESDVLDQFYELKAQNVSFTEAEVGPLVRRMLELGNFPAARRAWALAVPEGAIANESYDPSFRGLPGGKPFGWELANAVGVAARQMPGGGVEVEHDLFSTRAPPVRQTMLLPPGRYVLRVVYRGGQGKGGPQFVVRVQCRKAEIISSIPLVVSSGGGEHRTTFNVANGCTVQEMRLDPIPGDHRELATVRLLYLGVRPTQ